jgi:hypothetical protein
MDKPVYNNDTVYVYVSGDDVFTYVGAPVELKPMGKATGEIHDHECAIVNCVCVQRSAWGDSEWWGI